MKIGVLKELLLFLIPRFVTDEVVLVDAGDGGLSILCLLGQETEEDEPCGIVKMRVFAWLGWSIFPKQVGNVEAYKGGMKL